MIRAPNNLPLLTWLRFLGVVMVAMAAAGTVALASHWR
jgi:hypothetical protein